jgi:hypothetical protein
LADQNDEMRCNNGSNAIVTPASAKKVVTCSRSMALLTSKDKKKPIICLQKTINEKEKA